MRYGKPDWPAVVQALRGADAVTVACHVNPDGDALGSLLALALGLRKLGKRAEPTWGARPVVPPAHLAFLPGTELLRQPDEISPAPVFVALDCGAADRLGELEPTARRARVLINIDHHPANDQFGTLNVVVPEASSTAELVTHLLGDLGVELDRDIATCLYTGVVTDTGRFQYANARPETLRLAAGLLALDVPVTRIALEVFESAPFGYMKLLGRVLERAGLHARERFVYSWITQRDLAETGVGMDQTDSLIDVLRATRDADVAAMFKEQPDGRYRVSLRSRGPSVGAIARRHGGGGHELAAGMTVPDVETGVKLILEELRART